MRDSPILRGFKEIGEFLGVHWVTARKLARENGLPVMELRGQVNASKNAIEAWVIKNSDTYRKSKRIKQIKRPMWVHFCTEEQTLLSVKTGENCNWCDKGEQEA